LASDKRSRLLFCRQICWVSLQLLAVNSTTSGVETFKIPSACIWFHHQIWETASPAGWNLMNHWIPVTPNLCVQTWPLLPTHTVSIFRCHASKMFGDRR
jgi:hypothetical protein